MTAKARYQALQQRRQPFLDRARQLAELTIPSLLPPEGFNGTQQLPQPYSGLGARCVVTLASRLMIAQLPPGMSALKLTIPAEVLHKNGVDKIPDDLDRKFSMSEMTVMSEVERRMWRKSTNTTMQHLIVTGNALERMMPDNSIKVYRLDQFVCLRDPSGKPVEIIVEEHLLPAAMPDNLKALISSKGEANMTVPLYTHLTRNGSVWVSYQEIEDKEVPGTRGEYRGPIPWLPLRWSEVVGEDYGRGKAEEHAADLMSVEGLQKALIEGGAMASRHIQMVKPNAAGGLNLRRRLASAKNGDWVVGNPEDVGMLKFENFPQMQFVAQELALLKQDLSAAFLLSSGMRRDAERVTKYELSKMVEELEGTLGGVYSMLNQEMVLPRFNRLTFQMKAAGQLPPWPEGMVEPVILTGLEALGREQDVQRVGTALELLKGLDPQALDYVDWKSLLSKAFTGLGLPDTVRSEDDVQAIRQQRAQMEVATAAAPGVAREALAAQQQ